MELATKKNSNELTITIPVMHKLLVEFNGTQIRILLRMLMNLNENNICEVDVSSLLSDLEVSMSSVNSTLSKMRKYTFGKKLAFKIIEENADTISFMIMSDSEDGPQVIDNKLSPKEVLDYFISKYVSFYGISFSYSFPRIMKGFRDIVNENFTLDEFKEIIDLSFEYYDKTLKSTTYPILTPTIFTSWVFKKIVVIYKKQENTLGKNFEKQDNDLDKLKNLW